MKRVNNIYSGKSGKAVFVTGVIAALLVSGVAGYTIANQSNQVTTQPQSITTQPTNTNDQAVKQNASSQDALLAYLIEEEKLAHDVYTVMYEKYGARVFGNILQSEKTHQSKVLAIMQARNLPDPRSAELGKFTNQELQKLYDTLIEQGNKSPEEAYKVGVAIEEKDIADITTQLATATDQDIVSTLELLRSGSENHLRAFNRQLGQY